MLLVKIIISVIIIIVAILTINQAGDTGGWNKHIWRLFWLVIIASMIITIL